MKITRELLKEKNACYDGVEWVTENGLIGLGAVDFLNKLIESGKLNWASWLIVKLMRRPQYLKYAIYSAEQVIDIFENTYPEDNRPRKAIEAAKKVLDKDTDKNRAAADAAACAAHATSAAAHAASYAASVADAAACAAHATSAAAHAASYAASVASAAACAASYAASVASAAACAAYAADAADAAAYAADCADREEVQLRRLNYGITLLEGGN